MFLFLSGIFGSENRAAGVRVGRGTEMYAKGESAEF